MIKRSPKAGAVFSDCRTYRYQLFRIWDDTQPKVLFVMLNPSTADERKNDPTIRRCIGYARSWGYGGLYVGNCFAFRATDPRAMKEAEDPVGEHNDWHLEEMAYESERIILAWGNHGSYLNRHKEVISVLRTIRQPECLDITKEGQPKHPLYLRKTLTPKKYEASNELSNNEKSTGIC